MSPDITEINAKVSDAYFLAMGQRNIHSFLMLGVIDSSGHPRLLARYGKVFTDDYSCHKNFFELAGEGCSSRLANEIMVGRKNPRLKKINYKAYAITYEQLRAFLALIADILLAQSNPIHRFFYFGAYLPERRDDCIQFSFYKTLKKNNSDNPSIQDRQKLIDDCSYLSKNNTCRTFSVDILRAVLGFSPGISSRFYIRPDYQADLKYGELDPERFYILPPPPLCYKGLSERQVKILDRIYQRLEDLPRLKPENALTRQKFNTIKGVYQHIAGENNLQASELLSKLCEYERQNREVLYCHRAPNILSRLGLYATKTENLFKGIKDELLLKPPQDTFRR